MKSRGYVWVALSVTAVFLATTAVMKVVAPDPASFAGTGGSIVLAVVEFALAVSLFAPWRRLALFGAVVLAGGGVALSFLSDAPCGCLGAMVPLGASEHLLLAGLTGLWACLSWMFCVAPDSVKSTQAAG